MGEYRKDRLNLFESTVSLENFSGEQRRELFRSQPDGSSEDSDTSGQKQKQMKNTTPDSGIENSCGTQRDYYPSLLENGEKQSKVPNTEDYNEISSMIGTNRPKSQQNPPRKSSSPSFTNMLRRSSLAAHLSSKSFQNESGKSNKEKSSSSKLFNRFSQILIR